MEAERIQYLYESHGAILRGNWKRVGGRSAISVFTKRSTIVLPKGEGDLVVFLLACFLFVCSSVCFLVCLFVSCSFICLFASLLFVCLFVCFLFVICLFVCLLVYLLFSVFIAWRPSNREITSQCPIHTEAELAQKTYYLTQLRLADLPDQSDK